MVCFAKCNTSYYKLLLNYLALCHYIPKQKIQIMNSNKHLGKLLYILSILFFYLPLINFLYLFVSSDVYTKLYFNNDEFLEKYHVLRMAGNYPYIDLIWVIIAIPVLLFSKPYIHKFLFYPTLVIQLFILLIYIFLYLFFSSN